MMWWLQYEEGSLRRWSDSGDLRVRLLWRSLQREETEALESWGRSGTWFRQQKSQA